jgi:hypothetical protein
MQVGHIIPVSSTKEPNSAPSRRNKIYKTFIRLVATYGAESWTLSKDIAKRLATFQRKVLGIVFWGN